MADYGLEAHVEEMNRAAAATCPRGRRRGDGADPARPRFVAGALGPTSKTASISPDVNDPGARNVTWDELVAAYPEAARGLVAGGADILLIETIFDTLNGKAAIFAVESLFEELGLRLPVMVSGTITDASGRTLSGQTVGAFWNSVRHARPLAVGLNCASARGCCGRTSRSWRASPTSRSSTYPNAGLPNSFGGYDEHPPETVGVLGQLAREGAHQPGRRLLRHDARPRRAPSRRRSRVWRRVRSRSSNPGPAWPASSRSTWVPIRSSPTSASGPTSPARAPSPG